MTTTDDFTAQLARLFSVDTATETTIDWADMGIDPVGLDLDPRDREALVLLEPPQPLPWRVHAHDFQIEAADAHENYIAVLAGRGSGKTHGASHALLEWILEEPGDWAIVAPTFGDAVKICADGPSGFIKAAAPYVRTFNRNDYVIYMDNGSRIVLASADAPDRVRGWNLTGFWADEVGSWRSAEVWDEGLEFATRIGSCRRMITTTPKRGSKVLKDLLKRHKDGDTDVKIIRASTRANEANLSEAFIRSVYTRYAGTQLGRQELDGEMLRDVEGALVTGNLLEVTRVKPKDVPADRLWRIVVAIDPAVTNKEGSDEVGIVVAAIGPAPKGWQPPPDRLVLAGAPHVYLLEDASGRMSVDTWATRALQLAEEWQADAIVAETNNGGDLVESNLRMQGQAHGLNIPYIETVTASRGKRTRAEPVGGLFEQHRCHIVGAMPKLEDQWEEYVPTEPGDSPDRMDASVWAVVGLMPELGVGGSGPIEILSAG